MASYGFSATLSSHEGIDAVVAQVTEALQKEGFGVLTTIDVQAALKAKLGVDKRPYRILGACNPVLADQAVDAEEEIGLLLPCNVLVRENEDGAMVVSFIDPEIMLGFVGNEALNGLANEAKVRLLRACEALG